MRTPPKVLVAEGCEEQRERHCALLARGGLVALPAGDAADTLRLAREQAPDLVLLDVRLDPGSSAPLLGVLKASRGGDEFLPVVLLGEGGREERVAGLRCGADEVLGPTCDEEELLARVEALLRLKAAQDRVLARERELAKLSVTDSLTGLYNRRLFEERLREEFVRSQRFGDALSLIMIDLDHFKRVNDQHGHLMGDEVLRGAATLLRSCVREIDIVTRFGGEEFAIILPRTQLPGCLAVAERIWRAFGEARFSLGEVRLRVSASLGVACSPAKEVRVHADLLDAADRALYLAKRSGRDRIGLPDSSRPQPPLPVTAPVPVVARRRMQQQPASL